MGKRKNKNKQKKKGKSNILQQSASLIKDAENKLDGGEVEMALNQLLKAKNLTPNDPSLLSLLADVYQQVGMNEEALGVIEESLQLEEGSLDPTVWMMRGQLTNGEESLVSYKTGVNILIEACPHLFSGPQNGGMNEEEEEEDGNNNNKESNGGENDDEILDMVCSGLCSMAEVYLTDLRFLSFFFFPFTFCFIIS